MRERHRSTGGARLAALLLGALALLPAPSAAQEEAPSPVWGEVYPGGELEEYLRLLQLAGKSPLHPWSARGLSPSEVERLSPRDSAHPWAERYAFRPERAGGVSYHLHAPRVLSVYNSAFPYGLNDGPVWAGRGVTTAAQAGASVRYRGISLTLAPIFFGAQNAGFELSPHLREDSSAWANAYTDWRNPALIDLPQRYGEEAYGRVDWGQSTLRADLGKVALGLSSANQVWGPASEHPLVLGTNAPGFVHAFAGTSRPVDLRVGELHGRFLWGRLEQSPYASVSPDSSVRFMSGVVAVFTPRWIPGLEVGGSRFFHLPWPGGGLGWRHLTKPFETFVKVDLGNEEIVELEESVVSNQIASLFARWALPGAGFEVYGELASEDHRHNLRDFILEPDHNAAYMLGFRKLWQRQGEEFWTLRGELVNAELSHLHRGRRQEPFYIHARSRQGHTHRGQVLGSPAAYGGSGSLLAVDRYHPGGRWTLAWRRTLRQERGDFLTTGEVRPPDVMQGVRAEALLFRGRWGVFGGVEGVYNFNRDFQSSVFNLNAGIGVRAEL